MNEVDHNFIKIVLFDRLESEACDDNETINLN